MKCEALLRHLRRHGCVLRREGKEHTLKPGHSLIMLPDADTSFILQTYPDPPLSQQNFSPETIAASRKQYSGRPPAPAPAQRTERTAAAEAGNAEIQAEPSTKKNVFDELLGSD